MQTNTPDKIDSQEITSQGSVFVGGVCAAIFTSMVVIGGWQSYGPEIKKFLKNLFKSGRGLG